jgi:hypothetical protein
MPENFANRYQTTLSAGVTSGALTGTVVSATGQPTAPFRAMISAEGANTDEIVLVSAGGTTLTWTRAVEAIAGVQAASAHGAGATLTAVVTAAGLAALNTTPTLWAGSSDPRTWTGVGTLAAGYTILNAFTVPSAITVSTAYFYVAVQSGNIQFGIYSSGLSLLASTPSTACPAPGARTIALSAPLALVPGNVYYAAYALDNGTVSIQKMVANFNPAITIAGVSRLSMTQHGAGHYPMIADMSAELPGTSTLHLVGVVFA